MSRKRITTVQLRRKRITFRPKITGCINGDKFTLMPKDVIDRRRKYDIEKYLHRKYD